MALTLEEFLPKARQLNPDYTDDELIQAYRERYRTPRPQTVSPAPLMTLEEFLPKARTLNPDYSDDELTQAWQEKYGARGAREKGQGDFVRGGVTAFKQVPQTVRGLEAGAGAIGEKIAGEGGLFTALKEHGLKGYQEHAADIAKDSKPSDSVTEAYKMAKAGDAGALVDWLQYALGYGGGQALQMLATAGIGYAGGKLALQPAARTLADKMIAKESARLAATGMAGEQLAKQAVSNVAGKIGQTAVLAGTAVGMEGGEIYGGLVEKAAQEERSLTGAELAEATGATLGAGALEFIGDKIGLDLVLGKSVAGKLVSSRLGHAAGAGTLGLATEGGTEFTQTLLEEFGKGNDPFSPESLKQAVDASALGGVGGAAVGTTGGLVRQPQGATSPAMPTVTERQPEDIGLDATQPGQTSPLQIEGPIQAGEMRGGKIYAPGDVLAVSPLPDVRPVTGAATLDDAIAGAFGIVQGATETAKSRAAEFARMTAKAKNETDALLAKAPEKRPAFDVPTLPGPEAQPATLLNQPSPIVPGQAFTPRLEIDDPRARLAEERARMVAQREQQRVQQQDPVSEPVAPVQAVEQADMPLPSQIDLAYPSSKQVRDLIHEKGFHLDTPVFRDYLKMAVGKEKFSDLTPQELQTLAEKVQKIKAPQQPAQIQEAPPQVPLTPAAEKPYAPVTTIPEAQVPRSELTPEKNAEMLLRAEKAKADMEIAGTERGGRFFQDQPGAGSTQEVTGLKSATADWYRELTSGPSPAIRGDRKRSAREKIEVAIAKIIKDQGADRGKAVEQVKAALLQDKEFHQTEWGRDLNSITQGEWPSWVERPERVSAESVESPKVETQPIETLNETRARQPFQNVPRGTPQGTVEEPKKVTLSRKERLAQQKQKMEEAKAPSVSGFKTAKGSTYAIGKDGTTTRDKAPRPEHPGPKERGVQPVSEQTFYVDQNGLNALGEFQVQGGPKKRIAVRGDKAAIQYVDGKDAGKFESRTVTDIQKSPAVGLYPVELWYGGKSVHFGNAITEVYNQQPEPLPSDAPSLERQPATASPERAPAPSTSEAAPTKMVTLYRGEATPNESAVPDWVREDPRYQKVVRDVRGRWFTDSKEIAEWYKREAGEGGRIKTVAVPATELEKYRVSNLPDDILQYSKDPEREFFIPQELASAANEEEPFSLSAPDVSKPEAKEQGLEQLSIDVPPPTSGERPIIARETTPEESPLFSKAAQTPDAEQTSLSEPLEKPNESPVIPKQDSGSSAQSIAPDITPAQLETAQSAESAQSPTEIIADALRTAADKIEGKPPTEAIDTVDKYQAFRKRLLDGEVTLDEYKLAFQQTKDNKDAILAGLKKLNKDQLVKVSNSFHARKSESKDRLIEQAYDGMLRGFALGRGVSYAMTGKGSYENAMAKLVKQTTADDLAKFAEEVSKNTAEYKARVQGFLDPKTLEDFDARVRIKGEASLTPEQLARYDELLAQAGREKRKQVQEQKATVQGVKAGTDLQLIESKHTKTGDKLWVVKLANRVERAVYDRLNQAAHKLGGRYSSYNKDGAIPGFTFRSEEAAQSFMAAGKGETVSAAPIREAAKAEVQNNAVSKLREMADNLEEKADESLNADRKTNTAKRARQASHAENDAYANKALAETMRNLADAIESGEATHLSGLRTKAQVEMLDSMLERAKYDRIKQETKGSYVDYERQKHRKADAADAAFASYPELDGSKSELFSAYKDLATIKGADRLRNRFYKQAESVGEDQRVKLAREDVELAIEKYPRKSGIPWHWPETLAKLKRLESMGITSLPELRAALREYVEYRGKRGTIDKAKQLERELIGNKGIGNDFFPTPKETARRMVAEAGVEPGMKVLEPSAGNGNIAEAIRAAGGDPDVVEQSSRLREILEAKGFNLAGQDFMDVKEGGYDRIIMNPPFSNGQDAEHIQHAYTLLKPGGKLVAIAGEGIFFRNDAKATAFRQWLDDVGGTSEKLPEGTFQDASLMATTGVNARMVVVEKPEMRRVSQKEDSAPGEPVAAMRTVGIPASTEPVIFSYRKNEQIKLHKDYAAAKGGDIEAAVRLVKTLAKTETRQAVADRFGGAVFVAPMAQEASGKNAIPQALAAYYASAAQGALNTQIVQMNRPRHTGADPMQRIIARAQFGGAVRKGQRYVLVDDNLTLGGTLAELSDYIQRNGGEVAGIVVLTNANRSDTLQARPKQIRTIEERFGDVLREQLAIDPQALTGPEADYLIGLRDADALRARAAKASREREQRLSAKDLSRPEDSALDDSGTPSPNTDSIQPENGDSPFSFLMDERGSIPASIFGRRKSTDETGTIDPTETREKLAAVKSSIRPYLLGALGLEQLSQVYGNDHAEVKAYNKATQAMEADFTEMSRDSDKIARAWTELKIPVADKMAQVMEDARFLNFDPDPRKNQEADSPKKQALVTRFDQLPDDAKAVYRMARDFYTNMAEQRFQALKERIERAGGTPENTRKLVDRLQIAYEKVRSKVYFPFSRFGENIVIAKKMDGLKELDREVHAFESVAEAQKFATMMKLKGWQVKQTVAREYSVDKEGPASKIVREMHDIIKKMGEGQQSLPDIGVLNLEKQLLDSLNQSFLQALPDMSYAKHFIHAKDVKGASKDALRAFAHSALHGAHHISRIRHADQVTNALMDLDNSINATVEGDTTEARQVYNELVKRHNDIMNPNTHPFSAWLGQLGFTMSLGGVVATGITNATQVPLVTYPWLGARYGFGKASAALARAYKDFLDPRTLNKDSLFDATKSKLISESERKMLLELAKRGHIDLTQTMDLAGLSSRDNLSRKARTLGTVGEKVTRMLGFTFHVPEVMNRQVTALSTFRLEKEKGSGFEEALERAQQAIQDTHFIYQSHNRPRYMQGNFLRVLTMFKQYSQNIAYTYGRAASIWLDRNIPANDEEGQRQRQIAKRQLASMLVLQFGAAGALGMPFFGTPISLAMTALGAMGDDDEKKDWEVALRKWLDGQATSLAEAFMDDKDKAREVGKEMAEVVAHGASRLTPFDMATRLGQNDLFVREPQREREGRAAVFDWLMALGGPVPSYGVNTLLGLGDVWKGMTELNAGFFMRGVEELTPAVLRNGVKSLRYTLEGVRTRDEYKQLELSTSEELGQVFGFTPSRVAEMYESTTAIKNKEHRILNQQKALKDRFARAVDDQDDSAKQRILEDIRGFNERNPIFAITSNTLNRSLKARRQHEAGMERGMYLPPRRRALLEEGDFGDF